MLMSPRPRRSGVKNGWLATRSTIANHTAIAVAPRKPAITPSRTELCDSAIDRAVACVVIGRSSASSVPYAMNFSPEREVIQTVSVCLADHGDTQGSCGEGMKQWCGIRVGPCISQIDHPY